jgi:amino acid transporter
MALESSHELAPEQRLAKGALAIPDAIAISVSVLAPGMAMFLNVPGVAAVAGGSTPLAFLLGGIGCLALAFVIIGFTRRMATAGYAYTYASRSLGKETGFVAGWMYAFGLACFVPMTMAGVAYLFSDLVGLGEGWWFPLFLIGMVLLVGLSIVRIKVTTRLQLVVGAVTVLVILIVNIVTTVKGGSHGNTGGPFTFSHTVSGGFHGVFYGIILGVTSYIGFETAADFGEETKNPRRAIPIAIIAATGFAILFYLWTTYSMSIGFGVNHGSAFGSDPLALASVVMALISWYVLPDSLGAGPALITYFFWATLGTLAVIVVYIGLCFGGILFFRRTHRRWNPVAHVVVPLIGAIVFGAALYGSIYPVPPTPLNYTPYIALAWLIVGIVVVLMLRSRNPQAVERIGSILGEEGGDEAPDVEEPSLGPTPASA